MDELDRDPIVARWTRHHGLRIPYRKWWGARGNYEPDFLVELVDEKKELREVKGEHLFADANTARKLRAGDEFCRARNMKYRVVTKSEVNPELWAPVQQIVVAESPRVARPELKEDAYQPKRAGCTGVFAAAAAVAAAIVLLLLALRR